jgi:hypothetical protein
VLKLRQEQVAFLETAVLARFVDDACIALRNTVPGLDQSVAEADLREAVYRSVNEGRTLGIIECRDMQRYVNVIFELGYLTTGQEAYQWAQEFMADRKIPAADKVYRLESEAILLGKVRSEWTDAGGRHAS